MFINPDFTFNGKYSKDMGVAICTFDDNLLNEVGVEYLSDIEIENNLVEYNPFFKENPSETSEIELNLILYNPTTVEPVPINNYDIDNLYDWLITDNFAPFISDDNPDLIYYFKVVKLMKVLTFNNTGYLKVTFKPYSKYAYKRQVYTATVNGTGTLNIYNPSRQIYYPIIEILNTGNASTINAINEMNIKGANSNEIIIIDNLTKLVQNENRENKFNLCNRKWVALNPRANNILTLSGKMTIKIICEFPVLI